MCEVYYWGSNRATDSFVLSITAVSRLYLVHRQVLEIKNNSYASSAYEISKIEGSAQDIQKQDLDSLSIMGEQIQSCKAESRYSLVGGKLIFSTLYQLIVSHFYYIKEM